MGREARRVAQGVSSGPQSLPKVPWGIVGLDEVLQGGFPEGWTTLISGGPGTSKTMQQDLTGIGFSSLIDMIVLMQFVPVDSRFTRGLPIVKSRGSKHSHDYHQSVITDDGIRIADIPSGARPSLTGIFVAAAQPAATPNAMQWGSQP